MCVCARACVCLHACVSMHMSFMYMLFSFYLGLSVLFQILIIVGNSKCKMYTCAHDYHGIIVIKMPIIIRYGS